MTITKISFNIHITYAILLHSNNLFCFSPPALSLSACLHLSPLHSSILHCPSTVPEIRAGPPPSSDSILKFCLASAGKFYLTL